MSTWLIAAMGVVYFVVVYLGEDGAKRATDYRMVR
jgi:hypothetical protein